MVQPCRALGISEALDRRRELSECSGHAVLPHEQPRHLHVLLVVESIGGQGGIHKPVEELMLFHDAYPTIMTDVKQAATVKSVMAWIQKTGSEKVRNGMARYGLPADKAVGIPVGVMRKEAKRIGPKHALALGLWKTGNYEAQLMAAMLGEPERLTPAQMDAGAGTSTIGERSTRRASCCSINRRTRGRWRRSGRRRKASSRSARGS